MQVSVKNTDDVLASLLTGHSPITFSCFKNGESNRGRANLITAWLKMNMKKNFLDTSNELSNENILDD